MAHNTNIVELLPALSKAILQTVVYFDIFDYPVSPSEIHKYLHYSSGSLRDIQVHLHSTPLLELLVRENGYYALAGRSEIFEIRKKRQHYSIPLWERSTQYIRLLSAIPFVRFIAVTGGLCMSNTSPGSDIDVFILTRKGYLWRCRFIIQSIARWIQYQWGDVLCVNYILADDIISHHQHSLYLAHEFAQMKPQFGWEIYHHILEQNDWIFRYLPNFTPESFTNSTEGVNKNPTKGNKYKLFKKFLEMLPENTLRKWQINRIQKNNNLHFLQSPGVILEPNQYKMHDKLYGQSVTQLFISKCQSLNLVH